MDRKINTCMFRGKGSACTPLVYFFSCYPLRKWKPGKPEGELASVATENVARRLGGGWAAVS